MLYSLKYNDIEQLIRLDYSQKESLKHFILRLPKNIDIHLDEVHTFYCQKCQRFIREQRCPYCDELTEEY